MKKETIEITRISEPFSENMVNVHYRYVDDNGNTLCEGSDRFCLGFGCYNGHTGEVNHNRILKIVFSEMRKKHHTNKIEFAI